MSPPLTRGVDNFFQEGIGGYEFTGGFSDREVGSTGASDFGTFVPYTQAMADAGQWRRFGFSESQQQANDVAYFPTELVLNRNLTRPRVCSVVCTCLLVLLTQVWLIGGFTTVTLL